MYLRGDFSQEEGKKGVRLEAAIGGMSRKYKVNGVEEVDLVSYLDRVHAVIFFPESLRFVKEGPHLRRVAFDRAVAAEEGRHLVDSREYARLLVERNRILKQRGDSDMIDVWGERLLDVAARIIVRRYTYLKTLRQYITAIGERMGTGPLLEIRYLGGVAGRAAGDWEVVLNELQSGADPAKEIIKFLGEAAGHLRNKERERGRTLWGPHLDEFELRWGGMSAKEAASQGEQRVLMIILAMAAAESYTKKRGDEPIVLLDDLSSELDEQRRRMVLEYLGTMGAQVFVTSTEKPKSTKGAGIYLVNSGKISSKKAQG
jgi:DNA replication and repair protein RecF